MNIRGESGNRQELGAWNFRYLIGNQNELREKFNQAKLGEKGKGSDKNGQWTFTNIYLNE